jgi:hypothetical protein
MLNAALTSAALNDKLEKKSGSNIAASVAMSTPWQSIGKWEICS